MSTTMILFLQSMLIFLQMANAGLSSTIHNPTVTVLLAAFVGAFQFFVQHLGNQTVPMPPPKT